MRDRLAEIEFLSATAPDQRREDILSRVTDLFLITADRQTPADTAVFGDVLTRLASQVGAVARCELAHRLADAPVAPEGLLRMLVRDEIDVARPLLEQAPLTDEDLVEVALTGSLAHGDAISRRGSLSAVVTDVLIEKGDDLVLAQMASNARAEFGPEAFARLAERARTNCELREALLERADTPSDIVAALRGPRADADAVVPDPGRVAEEGAEIEWTIEPASALSEADPAPVARDPAEPDRPSEAGSDEARLAELALAGDLEASIDTLARLTGLDRPSVENCLVSAETPALVVLCKAHGFSSATFSALLQLRLSVGAISTGGIAGAMRRFDTMDAGMARRIMRFLQVRLANSERGRLADDGFVAAD